MCPHAATCDARWASFSHVNGVAVFREDYDETGEGGAMMVSTIIRATPYAAWKVGAHPEPCWRCSLQAQRGCARFDALYADMLMAALSVRALLEISCHLPTISRVWGSIMQKLVGMSVFL